MNFMCWFDISDFAHGDSWQYSLTTNDGLVAKITFSGPKLGLFCSISTVLMIEIAGIGI